MEFGAERGKLANDLFNQLSESEIKKFVPNQDNFLALPSSSKGTRRAAALLEKISNWNYANTSRKEQLDFKIIRDKMSWHTPIESRYATALPLIHSVSQYSQSLKVKGQDHYHLHYKMNKKSFLNFNYTDNVLLNKVNFNDSDKRWYHGLSPVKNTWARIEDLFEEIMTKEFKNPSEFYALSAELVWLIGNTQPMSRGSGTFAELMLAIVHMQHGLKPPILKTDYPQLDVLDITFPLDDYKAFFTFFFEPSTVPRQCTFPEISSSLSIEEQMKALYKIINKQNTKTLDTQTEQKSESSVPDLDTASDFYFTYHINQKIGGNDPLLFTAVKKNHVNFVKFLLENKANPGISEYGLEETPLFIAVNSGRTEIAEMLIQAGAQRHQSEYQLFSEVFGRNWTEDEFQHRKNLLQKALNDGTLLLLLAAKKEDKKMMDILIHHGANVNLALLMAIQFAQTNVVKIILREFKEDINFNLPEWGEHSEPVSLVLNHSDEDENIKIAKLLMEAKAEVYKIFEKFHANYLKQNSLSVLCQHPFGWHPVSSNEKSKVTNDDVKPRKKL